MNQNVVLYHAHCKDGFGAALSAWLAFKDNADYLPVGHGNPPPESVVGKTVYIVDFSYKRDVLIDLARKNEKIMILDHHISAKRDLEGIDEICPNVSYIFDMEKSGARITWEYFHPAPVPYLIKLIEDRDLWRFKYEASNAVHAALEYIGYDFNDWSGYISYPEDIEESLIPLGKTLMRHLEIIHGNILSIAKREMDIGGYASVPVANCIHQFASEVCNSMNDGVPFAATYYDTAEKRIFSLRSKPDGVDVSEVAGSYGGGGHARAAGFAVLRTHPLACI